MARFSRPWGPTMKDEIPKRIKILILLLASLLLLLMGTRSIEGTEESWPQYNISDAILVSYPQPLIGEDLVRWRIEYYADLYGVDRRLLLDLAWHESRFNPRAKNSEGSSAKGIYQFLDGTWSSYCDGDVYNMDDNIDCAARIISEGGISHWLADARVANFLRKRGHIN